jgi:hypothetical protein
MRNQISKLIIIIMQIETTPIPMMKTPSQHFHQLHLKTSTTFKMSFGYNTPTEYAQPHADPNSAAAQLGLI